MRILFSCSPGDGHFMPLLPLARAAAAAGHEIAFSAASQHRERIEAAGLTAFAAGLGSDELRRRYGPVLSELDLASLPVSGRRDVVYSARFAKLEAPARFDDLRTVARKWAPAAIVHESCDLAAPIVAAELGIPSIHHGFGRTVPGTAVARAVEHVAVLWKSVGLEPDATAGLYRGTFVDVCPPSLQDELPPEGTRVQRLRPAEGRRDRSAAARPLVYVTLGTAFNAVPMLRDLLAAFEPVDCDVLMTTGANVDPSALAPIPPNATVHSYVPQSEILPGASVVVAHGGSGSTWGALAHGCPLVFLPQGADQFENAAAVTGAGAGITLMPGEQSRGAMRDALERLLADTSYADAASTIATEIAAMPTADRVAALLFAV